MTDGYEQYYGDMPKKTERLDQISMFLQYIEENDPRNQLVGKEKSIARIEGGHMPGHIRMDKAIMMMFDKGQIKTGFKLLYSQNSEFRMSMSIDGNFIDNVTKQELRYYQHQYLHQEQEKKQKKSFWHKDKEREEA